MSHKQISKFDFDYKCFNEILRANNISIHLFLNFYFKTVYSETTFDTLAIKCGSYAVTDYSKHEIINSLIITDITNLSKQASFHVYFQYIIISIKHLTSRTKIINVTYVETSITIKIPIIDQNDNISDLMLISLNNKF